MIEPSMLAEVSLLRHERRYDLTRSCRGCSFKICSPQYSLSLTERMQPGSLDEDRSTFFRELGFVPVFE